MSNVELLEALRQLYLARGRVTQEIIDGSPEIPCAHTYRKRFGSLTRAYQMIGCTRSRHRRRNASALPTQRLSDDQLLEVLRQLLKRRRHLSRKVIDESVTNPCASTYKRRFGSLERAYDLIGWRVKRYDSRSPRELRQQRSNEELLSALRGLLRKAGYLNRALINDTEDMPSANAYLRRFGGLSRAYRLIRYTPPHGSSAR